MLVRKVSAVMLVAMMMFVGLLISDDFVEYRLSRGWNLIGGADVAFSSSVIEDVDEVIPPVYSYDPSGRVYTAVESIEPLVGYWVLCSDDVIVSLGDTLPDIECPPNCN